VGTSGMANNDAPHCLAEFMTLKDRSGVMEAYVDGNHIANFNCRKFD
jgi:hypothetical protein